MKKKVLQHKKYYIYQSLCVYLRSLYTFCTCVIYIYVWNFLIDFLDTVKTSRDLQV